MLAEVLDPCGSLFLLESLATEVLTASVSSSLKWGLALGRRNETHVVLHLQSAHSVLYLLFF